MALQIAILARTFALQDEFRVIELDHVIATAPAAIDGHRRGVNEARQKRRESVLERTTQLITQLDAAGLIVKQNTILHSSAGQSVIDALNSTAATVHEFHAPLGIESRRDMLTSTPWREALRDPQQRRTAGKEIGEKAIVGGAAVGVAALSLVATSGKFGSKPRA